LTICPIHHSAVKVGEIQIALDICSRNLFRWDPYDPIAARDTNANAACFSLLLSLLMMVVMFIAFTPFPSMRKACPSGRAEVMRATIPESGAGLHG
jgi:hypothetical protein